MQVLPCPEHHQANTPSTPHHANSVTTVTAARSQPLATEAGLSILKAGGNAVDAAIATAAALAVTEPCSTGLGGDCFLLYFEPEEKKVHALNGSGRSPAALTAERVRADCSVTDDEMPLLHVHAITVPGACAGWCDALEAWGSLPMATVLEPAIRLAEEGFPVAPVVAYHWAAQAELLRRNARSEGAGLNELLVADGDAPKGARAPRVGEIWRNPMLAATLREVAAGGKRAFYGGRVGAAIARLVAAQGGLMTEADLAAHADAKPTLDPPISTSFGGVEGYEHGPNGSGIAALLALRILDGLEPSPAEHGHNSADYLHALIEALRLAFADTRWYVSDPEHCQTPVAELLSEAYAAARRALINPALAAADVRKGSPVAGSDTVSFQVVDRHGAAVSMVNSNYAGFGTGLVPQGCGFSLQNRGANFSLRRGHPNMLEPSKRPYHTIIPAIATKDGELYATFTNMGGFMQPQGHVQLLLNMLAFGMEPQAAIDAPRFCIGGISNGSESTGVVDLEARCMHLPHSTRPPYTVPRSCAVHHCRGLALPLTSPRNPLPPLTTAGAVARERAHDHSSPHLAGGR